MGGTDYVKKGVRLMIKLGKVIGCDCPVFIAETAHNQHILIEGDSGSGKTTAIRQISKNLCMEGSRVLALNVNGSFGDITDKDGYFSIIHAKKDGIPLPILECLEMSDGTRENLDDVAEAVVEVFSQAGRMGYEQRYLLSQAAREAVVLRESCTDDMSCLKKVLAGMSDDKGKILLAKFAPLLERVRFQSGSGLWTKGGAVVLDLSGYQQWVQLLIAQLVMSILWRQSRAEGQHGSNATWLVVDEFQNYSLRQDSVLEQILREGRKFKLSLILGTQSLTAFETKKRAILQQSATKLYFRPVESDLRRIANVFPDMSPADARAILQGLRVGECLASGEFTIGRETMHRTLKINFQIKYEI